MTPQQVLLEHMGWTPPRAVVRFTQAAAVSSPPRKSKLARWTADGKCRVCKRERNVQHVGCAALLAKALERLARDGRCVVCDQGTTRIEDGVMVHLGCEAALSMHTPAPFEEALRLCRS